MTTTEFRRTPLQAVRLTDGTYVVRSGCCRPEACAPAVGVRCCPSAACDCAIPAQWLREPGKAPSAPVERRGKARAVAYASAGLVGAGALGGVVLGVLQAVAWLVSHALLIGGGVALILLLGAGLTAGRGGCSTTVRVTHRH